jgi:hypothetical protein
MMKSNMAQRTWDSRPAPSTDHAVALVEAIDNGHVGGIQGLDSHLARNEALSLGMYPDRRLASADSWSAPSAVSPRP